MAQYDFNVFKACNNKYKGYGRSEARIDAVDMRNGVCQITYFGCYQNKSVVTESIQNLVERYIKSTTQLPYITNPSKIKTWRGFHSFTFNDESAHEIDYMLIGIKEQYKDITEGIGAVKGGLTFNLQRKGMKIVFSGMMSSDIPFRVKEFSIGGKDIDTIRNEIKAYLFDTMDGIVNLC